MVRFLTILFLFPFILFAQPVGSIKTEQYQAEFEKKQSIEVVADYDGKIQIPIQILKIGVNEQKI
jgi:hypothetical protein